MSEISVAWYERFRVMGWMLAFAGTSLGCGSTTVTNGDGRSPAPGGSSQTIGGAPSTGGSGAGGGSGTTLSAGGTNSVGGSSPVSMAGSTGVAGSTSSNTGGTFTTGGALTTGGAATQGGTVSTGGIAGTGGTCTTGGALTTGGAATQGGAVSTGGIAGTGGSSPVSLPAIAVAAGDEHTCAVMSDHTVRCWGRSCEGQLGDGQAHDCTNGVVPIVNPVKVTNISQATGIAAGLYWTCAVLSTGKIQCWGDDYSGKLGDGTTTNSAVPVEIAGISTARAVVAGDRHGCALLADETARCWGTGGLGTGMASSAAPMPVVIDSATPPTVLGQIQSLATSPDSDSTCAVQTGGSVYCWGKNDYGQILGETATSSLVALKAAGIQAKAVAVGMSTTCALLTTGAISCWGKGDFGELGDGLGTSTRTPVSVALDGTASALSLGDRHGCAVLDDANKTMRCWGYNLYGEIGDGTSFNNRLTPVAVKDLNQVVQVSGGFGHTCAVVASGALYCWGFPLEGQLGPNAPLNAANGVGLAPVIVTGF